MVLTAGVSLSANAHATYSIVASDTVTLQTGGAGTSCLGGNDVYIIYGSVPGVGALHAQALFNLAGRERGVELLEQGVEPAQILATLTSAGFDPNADSRQYAVVDVSGRSAGFTGEDAQDFAGDEQGQVAQYHYSVQGNILTSGAVLTQAAAAFEAGGCDLAERLMAALLAGANGGEGDSRCTTSLGIPSDSAFLQVDVPGQPAGGFLSLRVPSSGEADPLIELRALFDAWRLQNPCPGPLPEAGAPQPNDAGDASVEPGPEAFGGAGGLGGSGGGGAPENGGSVSTAAGGVSGSDDSAVAPAPPSRSSCACGVAGSPKRPPAAAAPFLAAFVYGLRRRMRARVRARRREKWLSSLFVSFIMVLGLAACRSVPEPAFGSGLARVPASGALQRDERAMAERLNRDRAKQGLPPLRFDERLSDVARHHSADMRDNHFFEHDSERTGSVDNRLDAAGYLFLSARENLSEAPDIERAEDGLLDSPPHYANIMSSDVTHIGVGIVKGGADPNNLTITQVFAQPYQPEAPERAESEIFARLARERKSAGLGPVRRDAKLGALARRNIEILDAAGSQSSVERAGQSAAAELQGKQAARLVISTQIIPGSAQLSLPGLLLEAPACSVGLAVRRVKGDRGRPALQVFLLATEAVKK